MGTLNHRNITTVTTSMAVITVMCIECYGIGESSKAGCLNAGSTSTLSTMTPVKERRAADLNYENLKHWMGHSYHRQGHCITKALFPPTSVWRADPYRVQHNKMGPITHLPPLTAPSSFSIFFLSFFFFTFSFFKPGQLFLPLFFDLLPPWIHQR